MAPISFASRAFSAGEASGPLARGETDRAVNRPLKEGGSRPRGVVRPFNPPDGPGQVPV